MQLFGTRPVDYMCMLKLKMWWWISLPALPFSLLSHRLSHLRSRLFKSQLVINKSSRTSFSYIETFLNVFISVIQFSDVTFGGQLQSPSKFFKYLYGCMHLQVLRSTFSKFSVLSAWELRIEGCAHIFVYIKKIGDKYW